MTKDRAFMQNIAGVVLCGGRSTRFGSNKALARFQGRSLRSLALSVLSQSVGNVILSTGPVVDLAATSGADPVSGVPPGVITIQDEVEGGGPLAGIASVFASTTYERLLVLATDLPLVEEDDLKLLVTGFQAPLTLSRDAQTQRAQPLCGIWDRSVYASLKTYLSQGQRSVLGFVDTHDVHWIDFKAGHLVNINKKDDLQQISDQ